MPRPEHSRQTHPPTSEYNHLKPPSHAERQRAVSIVSKYLAALFKGTFTAGGYQQGALVDFTTAKQPLTQEIIIFGDLHARLDHLKRILEHDGNLIKIRQGRAILLPLGDIVHRQSYNRLELLEMASSVETFHFLAELKTKYPTAVYPLLGNHDFLETALSKQGIEQSLLFRDHIQRRFGSEYVAYYRGALMAGALVAVGPGFVALHGGPIKGARSLQQIREIKIQDRPHLFQDPLQWEATNNRMLVDKPDYGPKDVQRFLELCGQPDGVLIVGHTPPRKNFWKDEVIPGKHYVLDASNPDSLGYVRIRAGVPEFVTII